MITALGLTKCQRPHATALHNVGAYGWPPLMAMHAASASAPASAQEKRTSWSAVPESSIIIGACFWRRSAFFSLFTRSQIGPQGVDYGRQFALHCPAPRPTIFRHCKLTHTSERHGAKVATGAYMRNGLCVLGLASRLNSATLLAPPVSMWPCIVVQGAGRVALQLRCTCHSWAGPKSRCGTSCSRPSRQTMGNGAPLRGRTT